MHPVLGNADRENLTGPRQDSMSRREIARKTFRSARRRVGTCDATRITAGLNHLETQFVEARMRAGRQRVVWAAGVAAVAIVFVSGCSDMGARMDRAASTTGLTLTGAQEVPPVNTQASGVSSIAVIGDKTVTGGVQTTNLNATAAHIHMAPAGQNGPVIIPLNKTGDNTWSVPANTILTSAQFDAYRAGNLYVNVHSAANPGGEIRLQLKP